MSAGEGRAAGIGGRPARERPREVRIIGGVWKRSRLPVADLPGLRPTPDRVRVTLFNWLGQDLSGWRCLDAFAGTGALGLEAASRGAGSVVLLERDRGQSRRLQEAVTRLNASTVRVECTDSLGWMRRCAASSFDLVFIDPPFDSELALPALAAVARLLVPEGLVYLEAARALESTAALAAGYELTRHSRAGAVHFQLLRRTSAS